LLQSWETPDYQFYNPFLDTGPADQDFLQRMLAQTRNSRPASLAPPPFNITGARLHRITVEAACLGVHLTR